MQGSINKRIWSLIGINAGVLFIVLGLAYSAGARSGGLSLFDFGALPQAAGFAFLGALFFIAAVTLMLVFQLGGHVIKPVSDLLDASGKLNAGDYAARAATPSDEFGQLGENLNHAAELLAQAEAARAAEENLCTELVALENAISQATRGDYSVRAAGAHPAVSLTADSFNTLVETIARRLDRIRASSADISSNANQVLSATSEMTTAAAQQDAAAASAASILDELSGSTRQVSTHAESASDATRRALEFAEQGNRALRESTDGMQRVRVSLQATASKIKSLGDRSLEIYEIINMIHETNLLALNAIVESSRNNDGRAAVEVLSSELRKLSEHSRGATREIVALLKAIQAESNEAVVVMEQGNRVAETGSHLTEQAGKSFSGISTVLRQASELAQAISHVSHAQVKGTEALTSAVQAIASNARQNAGKARNATRAVEQITRTSDQLNQAVAQFRPPAVVIKHAPEPAPKPQPAEIKSPSPRNESLNSESVKPDSLHLDSGSFKSELAALKSESAVAKPASATVKAEPAPQSELATLTLEPAPTKFETAPVKVEPLTLQPAPAAAEPAGMDADSVLEIETTTAGD